jgi:putative Ca2+/H+ antiporter (TMEM165/GDT1 family)
MQLTAAGATFLAELGDRTQGASALAVAMWRVLKPIPMQWLTRGAAMVMLVLAGTSAYTAAS